MGGLRGLSVPPVLRRRMTGATRAAPGAADAAERMRLALRTAQEKLVVSQQKLQSSVAALRARLGSRP